MSQYERIEERENQLYAELEEKEEKGKMKHPNYCYSNDLNNNCIIIKWGESGYYRTDYPQGAYTDEIINEINSDRGITETEKKAMQCCSMAAQNNPNLNWEEHYEMCINKLKSAAG